MTAKGEPRALLPGTRVVACFDDKHRPPGYTGVGVSDTITRGMTGTITDEPHFDGGQRFHPDVYPADWHPWLPFDWFARLDG